MFATSWSIPTPWSRPQCLILKDLWNDYQKVFALEQRNGTELDFRACSCLASDWTREAGLCVDCENKFHSHSLPSLSLINATSGLSFTSHASTLHLSFSNSSAIPLDLPAVVSPLSLGSPSSTTLIPTCILSWQQNIQAFYQALLLTLISI